MGQNYQEIIKDTVSELLSKLGFEATLEVEVQSGGHEMYICRAKVKQDQNFLIGQYGTNLAAVQHLVRVMLRKRIEDRVDIIVDVNDYFLEKKIALEKEAEHGAKEALESNTTVALRPMLPYERKIVHSFLAENPRITTESIGVGESRKVMVSPKPASSNEADTILT